MLCPCSFRAAKYLINEKGELVGMFPPEVQPTEPEVVDAIEAALK